MWSALWGVKGRGKKHYKTCRNVAMFPSAANFAEEQMLAAFSLLDEFILLGNQLLLLWSCQMDLYVDLGQVGMSGEFGKAGSPCWQQPMLAAAPALPGDRARLWGGCSGWVPCSASLFKSSCFRLTWIMTIMRKGFLLAIHPQERRCLVSHLCFHFMPGVSRPWNFAVGSNGWLSQGGRV